MVKKVVVDIEGTISSISFVKDVLFPYSEAHMEEFIKKNINNPEVQEVLNQINKEVGKNLSLDEAINQLKEWIKEDKKITPLKTIQGLIWEEGYKSGELKSDLYEDAYKKLKEWKEKGIDIYVYSSGSVKAQKLFFSHTQYGDVNYLFSGYFDTNIGSKKESKSYKEIAKQINEIPENILFLSDIEEELDAAKEAGFQTIKVARYGNNESKHKVITNFEELGDLL